MTAKWAMARHTQTRGWQGRFRMSGRVVLEKLVALNGVYVDHTGALVTPAPAAARCLRLASERLCPSTRLHPPPAVLEGPVARDHPIDVAELGTNDAGELLGTHLEADSCAWKTVWQGACTALNSHARRRRSGPTPLASPGVHRRWRDGRRPPGPPRSGPSPRALRPRTTSRGGQVVFNGQYHPDRQGPPGAQDYPCTACSTLTAMDCSQRNHPCHARLDAEPHCPWAALGIPSLGDARRSSCD